MCALVCRTIAPYPLLYSSFPVSLTTRLHTFIHIFTIIGDGLPMLATPTPVEESQGTTTGSEVNAPSTSLTIFVPNLLGDSDSEAGNTPRNPILCGEISAPGSPGISGRSLGPEPSPLVASPLPLVPLAPVGPGGETPRDTDGVVI